MLEYAIIYAILIQRLSFIHGPRTYSNCKGKLAYSELKYV